MIAAIFIEPHERYEAAEAYRGRLTDEQMQEIELALVVLANAPAPPNTSVIPLHGRGPAQWQFEATR